jgi:hypothetical protein
MANQPSTNKVTRRADQTKASSTLRVGLTVRLVELLYPIPTPEEGGGLYVREIDHKWIYAFLAGELIEEIYAEKSGWIRMLAPGQEKNPGEPANTARYPSTAGYFRIADEHGEYAFFLSPVQLSKAAIDKVKQGAGNKVGWDRSNLAREPLALDGFEYRHYGNSGAFSIDAMCTRHSYAQRGPELMYAALLVDPFAWVEDIQDIGYQGALQIYDEHIYRARVEKMLAQTFQQVIGLDDDMMGLKNELAEKPLWFAHKRTRYEAPVYSMLRQHSQDDRRLQRTVRIDQGHWENLSKSSSDVLELRVKMFDQELQGLCELAFPFANEIGKWIESPRHKAVEQAAIDLAGDALQTAIVHYAKATLRLAEFDPGKKVLVALYSDTGRVPRRLIDQAKSGDFSKWWSANNAKKVLQSSFQMFQNALGAIALVEGDKFPDAVKGVASGIGLTVVPLDESKLPKFWGKPVLGDVKTFQLQATKGPITDAKEFFEKHNLKPWFNFVGAALAAINAFILIERVMRGKATWQDKVKAGLDVGSAIISGARFGLDLYAGGLTTGVKNLPVEVEKELAAEGAGAKSASRGLARIGGAISIVSAAIDFQVASAGAAKAYYEDRNYAVTVAQATAMTGAALSVTAGVFGLLFGEAVAGPVGWLALIGTLIYVLGMYLARKLARNKWEEVANYSFLGKGCLTGAGEGFYKDYFQGSAAQFGQDIVAQFDAASMLASAFTMTATEYADALRGNVKLYPGWVQPESVFRFKWQFEYAGARWITIEASLNVGELDITQDVKSEGFGQTPVIDWDAGAYGDGPTGIEYFRLWPRLASLDYRHMLPVRTTFLARVEPLGAQTKLPIPFDSTFEVKSGPLKGKHDNWAGYCSETISKGEALALAIV